PHLFVIFFPRFRFHTTGYIDTERVKRADSLRYIFGIQSAGDDNRAEGIGAKSPIPVERCSSAGRTAIKKERSAAIAAQGINAETGIDAKRLDHFNALDHRAVIRCFIPVQLDGMESQRYCKVLQILRIRMIYKHSD